MAGRVLPDAAAVDATVLADDDRVVLGGKVVAADTLDVVALDTDVADAALVLGETERAEAVDAAALLVVAAAVTKALTEDVTVERAPAAVPPQAVRLSARHSSARRRKIASTRSLPPFRHGSRRPGREHNTPQTWNVGG